MRRLDQQSRMKAYSDSLCHCLACLRIASRSSASWSSIVPALPPVKITSWQAEHTASAIRRSIRSVTIARTLGTGSDTERAYTSSQPYKGDPRHNGRDFRREPYKWLVRECYKSTGCGCYSGNLSPILPTSLARLGHSNTHTPLLDCPESSREGCSTDAPRTLTSVGCSFLSDPIDWEAHGG